MARSKTPKLHLDNKNLDELKELFKETKIKYEVAKSHFEFYEAEMLFDDLKLIKKEYKKLKKQVYVRDGEVDFFKGSITEDAAAIVIY